MAALQGGLASGGSALLGPAAFDLNSGPLYTVLGGTSPLLSANGEGPDPSRPTNAGRCAVCARADDGERRRRERDTSPVAFRRIRTCPPMMQVLAVKGLQ